MMKPSLIVLNLKDLITSVIDNDAIDDGNTIPLCAKIILYQNKALTVLNPQLVSNTLLNYQINNIPIFIHSDESYPPQFLTEVMKSCGFSLVHQLPYFIDLDGQAVAYHCQYHYKGYNIAFYFFNRENKNHLQEMGAKEHEFFLFTMLDYAKLRLGFDIPYKKIEERRKIVVIDSNNELIIYTRQLNFSTIKAKDSDAKDFYHYPNTHLRTLMHILSSDQDFRGHYESKGRFTLKSNLYFFKAKKKRDSTSPSASTCPSRK